MPPREHRRCQKAIGGVHALIGQHDRVMAVRFGMFKQPINGEVRAGKAVSAFCENARQAHAHPTFFIDTIVPRFPIPMRGQ